MADEKMETNGLINTVAGVIVKPVADQLFREVSDLWKIVSKQNDPKVTGALLRIENSNIKLQRKIRDLEYEVEDIIKEKNTIPDLVSGTYFFEDKGPCCTVCYDKENRKVIMTEKIVDFKKLEVFIELFVTLFLLTFFSIIYVFFVSKTEFTSPIVKIMIPFMMILLTIAMLFKINKVMPRIIVKRLEMIKESKIINLKCGCCKHRISLVKEDITNYTKNLHLKKIKESLDTMEKQTLHINGQALENILEVVSKVDNNLDEYDNTVEYNQKKEILDLLTEEINELYSRIITHNETIQAIDDSLLQSYYINNSDVIETLNN